MKSEPSSSSFFVCAEGGILKLAVGRDPGQLEARSCSVGGV